MIVESLAILLILLAMEVIFLRAHRKSNAVQIAPLLILPGGHFLANLVPDLIPSWTLSSQTKSLIDILCMTVGGCTDGILWRRAEIQKDKGCLSFDLRRIYSAAGFDIPVSL